MLSSFRWYRKLRGGRWAQVTGYMWGKRWIQVSDECVERVDEDWRRWMKVDVSFGYIPPQQPPYAATETERFQGLMADLAENIAECYLHFLVASRSLQGYAHMPTALFIESVDITDRDKKKLHELVNSRLQAVGV